MDIDVTPSSVVWNSSARIATRPLPR